MLKREELNDYARRLQNAVGLPYNPVAVKICETHAEIPPEAVRPWRDNHEHYGYCQAISLVKTTGVTMALTKEDHWCWKPLMAFGLVDVIPGTDVYREVLRNCGIASPALADHHFKSRFPMMPRNDQRAIVVAPLVTSSFVPDVVLVYCDTSAQLRDLLAAIKRRHGRMVHSEFDYMDSCVWSFFPTFYERDFRITLPDPGEMGRGCCGETELILSVPVEQLEMLVEECEAKKRHAAGRPLKQDGTITPDFPRPEFYNKLYEAWGLQVGEVSWREDQRGYKI